MQEPLSVPLVAPLALNCIAQPLQLLKVEMTSNTLPRRYELKVHQIYDVKNSRDLFDRPPCCNIFCFFSPYWASARPLSRSKHRPLFSVSFSWCELQGYTNESGVRVRRQKGILLLNLIQVLFRWCYKYEVLAVENRVFYTTYMKNGESCLHLTAKGKEEVLWPKPNPASAYTQAIIIPSCVRLYTSHYYTILRKPIHAHTYSAHP
jgi:hypothetical protein